jgi:RNA polymerase sigma-70 factor, ECF subfamily
VINMQTDKSPLNRVTAVFPHGAQSPQGAISGQIAGRIGRAKRQKSKAVAVKIKFAATAPQAPLQDSPARFRDGLLAEVPRLRAFARSMSRNNDRADDLVQETLAKAWAHRSKFKEGTNLGAWVFTILRNTYYGELRSRRREVADSNGHFASQLSTPPAQLHYLELQHVGQAFQALPAVQREALFLVGVSGLTYHAASVIGRCAVGTIKSRVFRARRTLLDKLEGPQLPSAAQIGGPQSLAASSTTSELP